MVGSFVMDRVEYQGQGTRAAAERESLSGVSLPIPPLNVAASDATFTDPARDVDCFERNWTGYRVYRATSSGAVNPGLVGRRVPRRLKTPLQLHRRSTTTGKSMCCARCSYYSIVDADHGESAACGR